jgi:hypothetical protein
MMEYSYNRKNLTTGFFEPVEANGMKLGDNYFVKIDQDMLDLISKIQQETTPDNYIAKWEKKLGEKLFLYRIDKYSCISSGFGPVNCDYLSKYVGDKYTADMRLADKDGLTRTAARKVAEICYHGKGDFNDAGVYAAIAMILYIRNGYNKKDFWANLNKEFLLGLEELLKNNGSIQIDEQLVGNPFEKEDATIMDLMDTVNKDADDYEDDSFVIFDSEIAEVFKSADKPKYYDEEINQALGQYVYVIEDLGLHGISKENILKDVRPSDLNMVSLDTSVYIAAMYIKDFIFHNKFCDSMARDELSEGVAVYRKNNLPEAEFWRNICRKIISLNEEEKWF